VTVNVKNGYSGTVVSSPVESGDSFEKTFSLQATHGWYDFTITAAEDATFKYQVAGHVETGAESFTDPAIAAV
jgi:phospholipase C